MKTKQAAKHTPGPWVISGRAPHDNSLEIKTTNPNENKRQFVCAVYPKPFYGDTQEADAHLISAAPHLLEGCHAAVRRFECRLAGGRISQIEAGVLHLIRAAIAKAEGGK